MYVCTRLDEAIDGKTFPPPDQGVIFAVERQMTLDQPAGGVQVCGWMKRTKALYCTVGARRRLTSWHDSLISLQTVSEGTCSDEMLPRGQYVRASSNAFGAFSRVLGGELMA